MMNRNLMTLCAVGIAGVLVGVAASSSTMAAFSDVTSNTGNTFSAADDFGGSAVTPVKSIGTASCGNSSNSLSVPAGGIAAGNTVIARLAHRTTNAGAVTISDNKNNNWTKDADVHQGSIRIVVFSAYITKALAQRDLITVTFPAQGDAVGLTVEEYSGIAATNRVDVVGSAVGDSATPTVSATTTNSSDLLYGAVASFNNRTYTEAAGWNSGVHQAISCGGAVNRADNHGAFRHVISAGAYTYNPSLSSSERWAAALVAYRAASGSPACQVPTPTDVLGFETGPNTGTGLHEGFATSGGIPEVVSTTKRNGDYSLKIPKNNSGASYYEEAFNSTSVFVGRFAILLESLPGQDVSSLVQVDAGAGRDLELEYSAAGQRFEVAFGAQIPTAALTMAEAGRWYVIDMKVDYGSDPRSVQWRIDGVDQPSASSAETSSSANEVRFGSGITADVFTAYYDDALFSGTAGDYPIGDGRVLALRPNGMGTNQLAANFRHENGSSISTSTYTRLDDQPLNSTGDYVRQVTADGTAYLTVGFQDITQTCIRGVSGIVAFNSASASSANNGKTSIFDGSTERVLSNGDMSGTGLRYDQWVVRPAAAYWTNTAVNGLVARLGYSTDNNPEPYWHALMLEYETLP